MPWKRTWLEFGFFSLPNDRAKEDVVSEKIIGDAPNMDDHPVITAGKAKGAATGYVYMSMPEKTDEGHKVSFTGVFGYDGVNDYWKWRETPEHAKVIEGMGVLANELGFEGSGYAGKEKGMFEGSGIVYVAFRKIEKHR